MSEPKTIGKDGRPWPSTFDAEVWAKVFARHAERDPKLATDTEAMLGWFANAIMAGYDHAKRETAEVLKTESQIDTELAELKR